MNRFKLVEMGGDVDPNHNSREEYERGGPQLSFEFREARNAGLTFEVAQRIFDIAKGMGPLVYPLIEKKFGTVEAVDEFVKSVGCWGDGTPNGIYDALVDYTLDQGKKL